jgi:hypothetical protein
MLHKDISHSYNSYRPAPVPSNPHLFEGINDDDPEEDGLLSPSVKRDRTEAVADML